MRRLTLLLALFLVAATPPQLTIEEAVKKRVKVVRAWTDKRTYQGFSTFDAYVTSWGMVNYFGTAAEMFQFEKCLDQHGHALSGEGQ